jgi:methionyl-tRNA synthetase
MEAVARMQLDQGLTRVAGLVRDTNRYLERRQPWTMAKAGRAEELATVLYSAAEVLRIVSGLLYPVMPGKMTELRTALGAGAEAPVWASLATWGGLQPGARIGAMPTLFPRIVAAEAEPAAAPATTPAPVAPVAPATPAAAAAAAAPEGVVRIDYADFSKVKLRTARILVAERVQGADKLLRLEVDLGTEKRQIVAGIAKHYAPESLPGRTIVVVANLKPAKLRGLMSDGMLLAAVSGEQLRILTVDGDIAPGTPVS